jgi:3-hydroxyacyl-CoA dehydrogenase/enoyl-CoA hydratase/3-hydroxybutyryl-CoA epimerase
VSPTDAVSAIHWSQDDDGVVVLTMDDPTQRVNTANELFTRSFATVLDRLEASLDTVTGVVLTSAKSTFFAGGDLNRFLALEPAGRDAFLADLRLRKSRTRRLERLGRPVVAAISGAALGGGLELALACHHRIAVDDDRLVVGLPEVTLGLLPGSGGVMRTIRMLGLETALTELILEGRPLPARRAHEIGLLDELVRDSAELVSRARAWILSAPATSQPWDRPGFVTPGGRASDEMLADAVRTALPGLSISHGSLDPTPRVIFDLAVTNASSDIDAALERESEALADLACGPVAKAKIAVVFFDTARLRSKGRRPTGAAGPSGRVLVVVAGDRGRAAADLLPRSRHVSVLDLTGTAPVDVPARLRTALAPEDGLIWAASLDGWGVTEEARESARSAAAGPICVLLSSDSIDTAGTVGIRVLPDLLSGTGAVVELEVSDDDGTADAGGAFDMITRVGALPVLVNAGRGPFSARLHEALEREIRALVAEGVPRDDALAARKTAGFSGGPASTGPGDHTADLTGEIARRLMRAMAAEADACCAEGVLAHLDDVDVASVRAGGFPAWTGGTGRWSAGTYSPGTQAPAPPG